MPRRKSVDVEKRQYWLSIFQKQQQSGLPIRRFCSQHHVNESSFYRWRKLLGQTESSSTVASTFLPVHVETVCEPIKCDDPLEVVLPTGTSVRVPVDFDADCLKRLLRVLEDKAC